MRKLLFSFCILSYAVLGTSAKPAEEFVTSHLQNLSQSLDNWGVTNIDTSGSQISFITNGLDFTLRVGGRTIEASGTPLHLGYPIQLINGELYLNNVDTNLLLKPLIFPHQGSRAEASRKTIVLDAGHGGGDPGATNESLQLEEKKLTLTMVNKLKKRLLDAGYAVQLTREDDTFLTLTERTELANSFKPLLFLSIHFNAATNIEAAGIESFATTFMNQPSTGRTQLETTDTEFTRNMHYDKSNTLLAYSIQKQLILATSERDRGVKRARFGVIKNIESPAALLELGFLSHSESAKKFKDDHYLETLAKAIVSGIKIFLEQ